MGIVKHIVEMFKRTVSNEKAIVVIVSIQLDYLLR